MGKAYLKDGSSMDYKDYIQSHPHWKEVRRQRLRFDNGMCVVCHKEVGNDFETHHLNYNHLGNEHMRDVVTMCKHCHTAFHNSWSRNSFWKGNEKGHWDVFDIEHTARMCLMYYKGDRLICKDVDAPNYCNSDIARAMVDRYFKDAEIRCPVQIDPNDFTLFVRNKRYELFLDAKRRGLDLEQFLDEYYGPKIRGKNPLRAEAGKNGGTFVHKKNTIEQLYKMNANINRLMELAKKMEEENE